MKKILWLMPLLFVPNFAYAADFASWQFEFIDQVNSFKAFMLAGAYLFGLIIFIMGLYDLYLDAKKPGQELMKKGIIAIFVGTAFLIVPTVIAIAGGTAVSGESDNAALSISVSEW